MTNEYRKKSESDGGKNIDIFSILKRFCRKMFGNFKMKFQKSS